VSASTDPDHDWDELKETVETQADDPADPAESEGATTTDGPQTDGTGDGDPPTRDVEDSESTENSETEPPETPMPTDEELARQRQSNDDPEESDDEPETTPTPTDDSDSWGIPIPVSSTTLMMGGAMVLIFGLLYLYVRTGSSGSGGVDADDVDDDQDDAGDDEPVAEGEVTLFDDE